MQSKRFKKENILTIPNLLSLIRLLLIPLIVWLYCARRAYKLTVIAVAVSAFTDIVDGKIARKFNMVSDVGKVLDPIADKLTQAALVICLISRYRQMWALLALLAVKECLMILWGYQTLKRTDTINSAKWYGKLSTVALYAVMMVLIVFPDIPEAAANALMLLCGAVMLLAIVLYGRFYHGILSKTADGGKRKAPLETAWKAVTVLIWAAIIAVCVIRRDALSVEAIASYTPQNKLLAVFVMLAFFALKSLSIVVFSGLLYAASGVLFPLPAAIAVNLAGSVIMLTLPYWIGRKSGACAVDSVRSKYPKVERMHELRARNDAAFAFLARMMRVPNDIASLYMGAIGVEYKKYLLGSMLGVLPHTIIYPVMGMSIQDVHSPEFLISLCAEIAYLLISSAAYALYRRRSRPEQD